MLHFLNTFAFLFKMTDYNEFFYLVLCPIRVLVSNNQVLVRQIRGYKLMLTIILVVQLASSGRELLHYYLVFFM